MARKKDKTLKKQKQAERQRAEKNKKIKNYALGIVAIAIAGYLIYLWISWATAPQYIPEAEGPSIGPEDADVVFMEFGCFTCPFTQQFNLNTLPTLIDEYSDEVKFVYRNAPIYSNPGAEELALAGLCADEQGEFWDYSERLFSTQGYDVDTLTNLAGNEGMDEEEFRSCLEEERYLDQVDEDYSEAREARVGVTPTVFVNDVRVDGNQDLHIYQRLLDDKLEKHS